MATLIQYFQDLATQQTASRQLSMPVAKILVKITCGHAQLTVFAFAELQELGNQQYTPKYGNMGMIVTTGLAHSSGY